MKNLLLLLCLAAPAFADSPAWIEQSNAHAQLLLDPIATLSPEFAGQLGVRGYDEKIADLGPGMNARSRAAYSTAPFAKSSSRRSSRKTADTQRPLAHKLLSFSHE